MSLKKPLTQWIVLVIFSCLISVHVFFILRDENSSKYLIYFHKTDSGAWYYDKNTIKSTSNGVEVIVIQILSEEGKTKGIELRKADGLSIEGYDEWSKIVDEVEYDCEKEMFRIISSFDYDKKGKILSSDVENGEWKQIDPRPTVIHLLKHIICKKPRGRDS